MVYHVLASEIAANFYWVLPHLACHAAVKGDAVRFTRHNADEALPSLDAPHDLLRAAAERRGGIVRMRSEEHTSELQSRLHLVCRLLLEKKKIIHLHSVI